MHTGNGGLPARRRGGILGGPISRRCRGIKGPGRGVVCLQRAVSRTGVSGDGGSALGKRQGGYGAGSLPLPDGHRRRGRRYAVARSQRGVLAARTTPAGTGAQAELLRPVHSLILIARAQWSGPGFFSHFSIKIVSRPL